jgi:hypothetical protein
MTPKDSSPPPEFLFLPHQRAGSKVFSLSLSPENNKKLLDGFHPVLSF